MQDAINEKSFALAARVGKATAAEINKAMQKLLAELKSGMGTTKAKAKAKSSELKHGKQTMKQLSKHNAGLSSIELKDPNLRLLYHTMKENGVDFAPAKDGKGKVTLFFKGRDADALTHAFSQYTQKVTAMEKKPSIRATLTAMKQKSQTLNAGRDKVKNLNKGAREK
jgi:hypothetical protein